MVTVKDFIKKYSDLALPLREHNLSQEIQGLASEQSPQKQHLVFISKPENFERIARAEVACLVVPKTAAHLVPEKVNFNILTTDNSRLLMALATKESFAKDKLMEQFEGFNSNISVAAIIHPSCKISTECKIGPNVVIGKNVTVEKGAVIAASAVIQSGSFIGANSRIHEFAYIGEGSQIGNGCEVFSHAGIGTEGFGYATKSTGEHEPISHQGHVVLEDYVHVGSGTQIDRGTFGETRIGLHTKIDNLCHIAHNCKIGKYGLITAGFKVAGSTSIGNYFTTGGNATVTGHIKIADKVNLAGLSVVHKDIKKSGSYYGYPLKPLKEGLKNNAAFGSLAQMKKDLAKVMKVLNLKD